MIVKYQLIGVVACLVGLGLAACAKRSESPAPAAPMRGAGEVKPEPAPAAPVRGANQAKTESAPAPAPATPSQQSQAAKLDKQLAALGAKHTERGFLISLSTGAPFAPGQTSFQPSDTTRIDRIADLLKQRPELQLQVVGYTDSHGSTAVNERVSRQRAESARQALINRWHIDPQRISAKGMGDAEPIASNDTAEGRQRNRRVELIIADNAGRLASTKP